MLRKLKLKFVTLAMTALVALMVVVVAAMNIINYVSVVDEADSVLSFISENQGDFFSREINSTKIFLQICRLKRLMNQDILRLL